MYIVKSRFFGETRAGINDEKRAVWAELHGSEMLTKFIKLDTRLMEIQVCLRAEYSSSIKHYVIESLSRLSKNQLRPSNKHRYA